jgi:hypothetical protein
MNSRKLILCGNAGVKKCVEIVLVIMMISLSILWVPARTVGLSNSMVFSVDADKVDSQSATGQVALNSSGDTGSLVGGEQFSEDSGMTETGYRIKPLQDRLAQMSEEAVEAYVDRYEDMETHWSRQVAGKLTGLDIIDGYDGRFWPDDPVQADQFIKMAILAMGYKIEQGADYWAQPYIDAALKEGIVEKGEIADYRQPLSRELMVRIVVRTALKIDQKPDSLYDPYIIGRMSDYEEISDDLKQYAIDGYRLGLVQGSGEKFRPKDTLTRAEAAAVIIRILDVTERKPTAPSKDEMINFLDSKVNSTIVYPGSVRELFTVAKAVESALPKAKGFVPFYITDDEKYIFATMYKDKAAYENDSIHAVARFQIAYNANDKKYAYTLSVGNDDLYEELFSDFMKEILKTIYEKDAQKAIQLHDQYMTQRYTRIDGLNDYTRITLNNRDSSFLRHNDMNFTIQIKLKGVK